MPPLKSVFETTAIMIVRAAAARLPGSAAREVRHRERDRVDVGEPGERAGKVEAGVPEVDLRGLRDEGDHAEEEPEADRLTELERIRARATVAVLPPGADGAREARRSRGSGSRTRPSRAPMPRRERGARPLRRARPRARTSPSTRSGCRARAPTTAPAPRGCAARSRASRRCSRRARRAGRSGRSRARRRRPSRAGSSRS